MFFKELQKSFRSLLMHRLRAFLSTLGVLFGVAAMIAMQSIGEGAKQQTLEQIEQLGAHNIIIRAVGLTDEQALRGGEPQSKGLSWEDVNALEDSLPMLRRAAPLKVMAASLGDSLSFQTPEILAVSRTFGEIKQLQTEAGRLLCDLDVQSRRNVCVLGNDVAKALGIKGHVGGTLRIGHVPYAIVGVLKPKRWKGGQAAPITARNMDKLILIPIGSEIDASEAFLEIILEITSPQWMGQAAELVKNVLFRLHGGYENYQLVIPQELLRQAYRTQHTFNLVLGSIAAISLAVGGIGIMNIMLATVSERTREIGIRRAIGASRKHILAQFLIETLLLTVSGALLGIIAGVGFSEAISCMAGWKTIVTVWSILFGLAMSLGVGLCSGLYPAYRAAMMDPIAALR